MPSGKPKTLGLPYVVAIAAISLLVGGLAVYSLNLFQSESVGSEQTQVPVNLMEPRIIEDRAEAEKVFAFISEGTLARMAEQTPVSMVVVLDDSSWLEASVVLPEQGFIVQSSRLPLAGSGAPGGDANNVNGYTSQAMCPGHVYQLFGEEVWPEGSYGVGASTLFQGVARNIALERFSPDLWITIASEPFSDAAYPVDTWVLGQNDFLAMNSDQGVIRRLQFDDSGALVALSDTSVPPLLRDQFIDDFASSPSLQVIDEYLGEDTAPDGPIPGVGFLYGQLDGAIAGLGSEDINWFAEVGRAEWEWLTTAPVDSEDFYYEFFSEGNLASIEAELGLNYVYDSIHAVRLPDGEPFGIAAFADPGAPGEPYTFITADRDGNSPAIDSQGEEIICTTGFDTLTLESPSVHLEGEEEFFVE